MAQTKAKTSVKDKALYKRLRNLGVSVKESTRVANAGAKTPRQKAVQPPTAYGPYPAARAGNWARRREAVVDCGYGCGSGVSATGSFQSSGGTILASIPACSASR